MDNLEKEGRIDRLRRSLYSRKAPDILDAGRTEPKPVDSDFSPPIGPEVPNTNNSQFDILASKVAHSTTKYHSFARKLFYISLGVFVVSIGVAGFVVLGGFNRISSKNVDINVVGPITVGGGQELSLDVVAVNKNNVDLESVKMIISYPDGAKRKPNLSQDLNDESFTLGTIKKGESSTQPISLFIFGEKGEEKEFKITLDYKVKNSNAKFFKEKIYKISINSSPIIVTSTYPKEVNSNHEVVFSLEVVSNSADAPKDFLLNVDYPFGFSYKSASPEPSFGNHTWKFSGLEQGSKRTVTLRGILVGQDNEERIFKVSAGTMSEDDPRSIGVSFLNQNESILIKKSFIGLDTRINGQLGDYVAQGDGSIGGSISIRNNTDEKLYNVVTTAVFSGPAFSNSSMRLGQNGFFRSIDQTAFWDERSVSSFASLLPSESESLTFNFAPLSYELFPKGSKPEIYIKLKVVGDRILSSGETEKVETVEDKLIKFATNLTLSQKVVRNGNNITNIGPIPPRANVKSTYTVVWSVKNTFNIASNVSVRAVLPPYIEWTGILNPISEKINYNPDTHEISWNAGTVLAGTGYASSPKEVAFQVSFLPSSSQVGSEPELVGAATISGIDKVTGGNSESSTAAVTTKFFDSSFKAGDERVVQ